MQKTLLYPTMGVIINYEFIWNKKTFLFYLARLFHLPDMGNPQVPNLQLLSKNVYNVNVNKFSKMVLENDESV